MAPFALVSCVHISVELRELFCMAGADYPTQVDNLCYREHHLLITYNSLMTQRMTPFSFSREMKAF